MFYIKVENNQPVGYPLIEENLRYILPNLSTNPSIDELNAAGYAKYQFTDKPVVNWNQTVQEGTPISEAGSYIQHWVIQDLTGEELATAQIEFQKEQRINFKGKTEWRLDEFARTKDYTTMLHACSYAVSLDPEMQAEGQLCSNLRDATWKKIYQIIAEIDNGVRPIETTFEDIENELPQLSWV